MKTIVLFLFIVFAQFSSASILPDNCGEFSGWKLEECQNILEDSSLGTTEKEDLYFNLLVEQGELGSFDFVHNWNKKIEFNSIPLGVEVKNDGIIKNAWVKLVSVNKSYFDFNSNEWFVQGNGKILSASGFSVELPTEKESGDCETRYSHIILNNDLTVGVNDSTMGSGKIVSYVVSVENNVVLNFFSNFFVRTQLKVEHYRLRKRCERIGVPRKLVCYNVCEYSHSDYRENQVSVSNIFDTKAKSQFLSLNTVLQANKNYNELSLEINSVEPINAFELNFGDSVFFLSESNFDIAKGENDSLYVTKTYEKSMNLENFVKRDYSELNEERSAVLWTENKGDCSYVFYSDFSKHSIDCGLVELKPLQLFLSVDGNYFDFDENLFVKIMVLDDLNNFVSNKKVFLEVGENTLNLITNENGFSEVSVSARDSKGFLLAFTKKDSEFKESKVVKRFLVTEASSEDTASGVVAFFGAYYAVFLIAKKVALGAF